MSETSPTNSVRLSRREELMRLIAEYIVEDYLAEQQGDGQPEPKSVYNSDP